MTRAKLRPPRRWRKREDWYKTRLPGHQIATVVFDYCDGSVTGCLDGYHMFGTSTWRWSLLDNGEVWSRLLRMNYASAGGPPQQTGMVPEDEGACDPPMWSLRHKLTLPERNAFIAGEKTLHQILAGVIVAVEELSQATAVTLTVLVADPRCDPRPGPPWPGGADVISNGKPS